MYLFIASSIQIQDIKMTIYGILFFLITVCNKRNLATLPHLQPVLNSLLSYLHIQKEKAPLVLVSHQPYVGLTSLMSQVVESELPRVYAHNVELERSRCGYACVARACSSSAMSGSLYELLFGVILQICHVYDVPYIEYRLNLKSTKNLLNFFYDLLQNVSLHYCTFKPLVVVCTYDYPVHCTSKYIESLYNRVM